LAYSAPICTTNATYPSFERCTKTYALPFWVGPTSPLLGGFAIVTDDPVDVMTLLGGAIVYRDLGVDW
jgi:hypothetical protein